MKAKEAFKRILSNKKIFGLTVLIDFIFYFLFFIASPKIFSVISPTKELFNTLSYLGLGWLILILVLIFIIFTYFTLVLIYSFCKHLILYQLENTLAKKKLSFSNLPRFFHSNLVFPALLMLAAYLMMPVLADAPDINWFGWLWLSFLLIVFTSIYALLNIRHSLFSAGKKYSVSASVDELAVFKKYRPLAKANLYSLVVFFAIFFPIGYILKMLVESFKITANAYNIYTPIFSMIFGIFTYSLFFYNRAYFYYAAREKK